MATERDLANLLPSDPPPRPARREEAIGAALRRFDGVAEPRRTEPARRSWRIGSRPQIGGLIAAAFIAAVGLPLWLSGDRTPPMASETSVADVAPLSVDASTTADVAAPPQGEMAPMPASPAVAAAPGATAPPAAAMRAKPVEEAPAAMAAASAPPAAPAPPPPPPPPASSPAFAMAGDVSEDANIVVTGSRADPRSKARATVERRAAMAGAWNACTAADPRQNLAVCRRALRADAPGSEGQSSSRIAEGLSYAWQDDDDAAIAAFDRAIALTPKSGLAWLNRGIVHAKAGDENSALADLTKAIKFKPQDARAWLQRSLVYRRQGNERRADADASRAVELNPSLARLFEDR